MDDIAISEVTEDNLPEIYELLKILDEKGIDFEKMKAAWNKIKAYPDYKCYAAMLNGVAAGTFSLLIADNMGHSGASFAVLENVVVKSGYRSKGIGKTMVLEALRLARNKNCYKLILSSAKHRKHSHEFYRKLGFEQHGLSFDLGTQGDRGTGSLSPSIFMVKSREAAVKNKRKIENCYRQVVDIIMGQRTCPPIPFRAL